MEELGTGIVTQWVPVITVAKLLAVSKTRVYALCKENKLTAQRVDGVVLVSLRSVQAYNLLRRSGRRSGNGRR